jgi:NAD(P)-dependent dehydrogenase (short-subunit alcohol dehydrogenase family)
MTSKGLAMAEKVILVTGATGGLGNFVTQSFLDSGAMVAGIARSIKQTDFKSPNFFPIATALDDRNAADSAVRRVVDRFGRVDVLVHLIGGFAGGKPVAGTEDVVLERMADLNFRSAFLMIRATLPHMRAARQGRIIAIGSRAALEPTPGAALYAAFKAALVSLVRSVAAENKDAGINANVILPGTMDTPANRAADPNADFSKWIDPKHVAELISWLASDAASQINGAAIPVYGRDV